MIFLLSLDISSNSIGDMGLVAIADALNVNTTLQRLLIFGNHFGEQSSDALRELSETRFRLIYDLEEKDFQSYVVDGRPYFLISVCSPAPAPHFLIRVWFPGM